MSHRRQGSPAGQQLAIEDPEVRAWHAELGMLQHAVSIRLVGVSQADVVLQIERLERAFGKTIAMTSARRNGTGTEWVAYGTITS